MITEIEIQLQHMTHEIINGLETWIKERRGLRSHMQSKIEVQLKDINLSDKMIIAEQAHLNELTDNIIMYQIQKERIESILNWIQTLQKQLQISTGRFSTFLITPLLASIAKYCMEQANGSAHPPV